MSAAFARWFLAAPLALGIIWTIIAVNVPQAGRDWVTSRVLSHLVEIEPILIGLWALLYAGCTHALTRQPAELYDILLIAVCWAAFGHICWRLG